MTQWVKVEFYGRLPEGQAITGLDEREVAANLGKVFGFTYVDGLHVAVHERSLLRICQVCGQKHGTEGPCSGPIRK